MHVKKTQKVILSIFLTILFLSLQFIVGGRVIYAEGWKNYNSNGVNFETGSFIRSQGWHTPFNQFDTIQVFADQSGAKVTTIDNPTANGSYPTVSYSFVGAGFSSISSNYSYTSSKEVVVSGLSLGHMYTTYSNSGIEQVVKLDGPDASQSTNFNQISVNTGVHYYLEFGSIDTSIRPQFTATPSQYNGINYNLYSVDSQYISSEEGTYNLTGFNLGSEIRWPDDNMYGLTLVQDVNVPQNGVYISDSISVSSYQLKPIIASPGVVVKYLDENSSQEISSSITLTGNIGDTYQSDQKSISGYSFKQVQGSPSGQFTNQLQTVVYLYTKDAVPGGSVTIRYVDEKGAVISPDIVNSGNIGDTYQATQKNISGYSFKEVQGNPSGKFLEQPQTITYVYTKNPIVGGSVTIKYIDDKGNEISSDVVKTGNIGESYQSEQKNIPGYTFKQIEGVSSGKFTDQNQVVKYIYIKNGIQPNGSTTNTNTNIDIKYNNQLINSKTNVNLSYNYLGKNDKRIMAKSLPQTGDDYSLSKNIFVLGLLITLLGVVLSLLRFKKFK